MLIRLLRRFLRPHGRLIALVLLLQLTQSIATLYLPALNADIIDNGVITGHTGYIGRAGGIMIAVVLGQLGCALGTVYAGARIAAAAGRDVRSAVFDRVQGFSTREMSRFGVPSLITRTTNDVQQVQTMVLMTFTIWVSAPIIGVGGVLMALNQSVPLSLLLLVVVPVLGTIIGIISVRMGPGFRQMQQSLDLINQVQREQITGVRVIRAFARDDFMRGRFSTAATDLQQAAVSTGRLMALLLSLLPLAINVASVAVLWFGGHLIGSGSMRIGALTAFLTYLALIFMAVMMATVMFILLPRSETCAGRIQEVLDTESSVARPIRPARKAAIRGNVELRAVGFRYPGAAERVLSGINLSARPGTVTAVIGSTGSGKTTLLRLIVRLSDASAGRVVIDDVDVRDLDPEVLSGAVGYVPQKPYLFSGTVASNLRFGNQAATEADMWRALETAQARDFVKQMPGGLSAEIAQGGSNVSGGQRQRLAIARAVIRRPRICVLDDSFSALDYSTENALRASLADQADDTTIILAAQRVGTIQHADRIVVLERGQIAAAGTHGELMDASEIYREIVLSQMASQ